MCDEKLNSFIKAETGDLCPLCGSLGRTRFLRFMINEQFETSELSVLHFSPHRTLSRSLKAEFKSYQSSNYEDGSCDLQLDIQETGLNADSYDLIICFHVLEHIPDDRAAMQELFRILKPSGNCLIQVPFRVGEMLEDPSITDPDERLRLFGQEDHLRWYNLDSLIERLTAVGFECTALKAKALISETDLEALNIATDQLMVKASKPGV